MLGTVDSTRLSSLCRARTPPEACVSIFDHICFPPITHSVLFWSLFYVNGLRVPSQNDGTSLERGALVVGLFSAGVPGQCRAVLLGGTGYTPVRPGANLLQHAAVWAADIIERSSFLRGERERALPLHALCSGAIISSLPPCSCP